MKTEWDYTKLADAYLKRPDYAASAIDALVAISKMSKTSKVCDVGAGVGHLTLMLANYKPTIIAVEPNDAMRANGMKRSMHCEDVSWVEGTGENTLQPDAYFDLVTFGSSFNVCDRDKALQESKRILKPGGWFACMWNHRDLDDQIQSTVENIIKQNVPNYGYGSRREDQLGILEASNLFEVVLKLQSRVIHGVGLNDYVEAWRSHATLERQAGKNFEHVIDEISKYLTTVDDTLIQVPYTTSVWIAKLG